jgi:hypothetical protein
VRRAFAAICLLIVAWTVVMSALEPVMLDGWFIDSFDGSVTDFLRANWNGELFWGNARLGQMVVVLTYGKLFHLIFTPLCVLALFLLMVTHVRGRWPVWSDAWMLLLLLGLSVLAQPQLGPLLFYRPFTANYVFGLVVQLAWLVPYRFALARTPSSRGALAAAGMLVLGVAAGMCNEHTGPALIVAVVLVMIRQRSMLRAWMIAGVVGFVAGYLALMLGPAQAARYCGASELSLAGRIVERGFVGNLELVFAVAWAGRWAWIALAIAAVALRRRLVRGREAVAWITLGVAISVTLLASPKQGDRLEFAALVFATIGIAVIVDDLAADRARARRVIASVSGLVTATAVTWSIVIQARVAGDYAERRSLLAAAPPNSVARVPMLRDGESRWFIGDDLPSDTHRSHAAHQYGLYAIDLEGHPTIPYELELRYQLAGNPRQTAKRFAPIQHLCEARHDFEADVAKLRATHDGQLAGAELAISTLGPMLDGRELAASRWRDGHLVAPSATVVNEDYVRWISIDRNGLAGALDVILVGPGRVEHLVQSGERWSYRPWGRGMYWVVACAAGDCYLVETIRHTRV